MKIIIIGKNSNVWRKIQKKFIEIFSHQYEIHQLSHQSDLSICSNCIVILLSMSKKFDEINKELLVKIKSFNPYSLILISSISVEVAKKGYSYKYPLLKKSQEDNCISLKFNNLHILRLGSVVKNEKSKYRNPNIILYSNDLCDKLRQKINNIESRKVIIENIYTRITINKYSILNFLTKKIFCNMLKLCRKNIFLLRFVDIPIKYLTNINYGYALLIVYLLKYG